MIHNESSAFALIGVLLMGGPLMADHPRHQPGTRLVRVEAENEDDVRALLALDEQNPSIEIWTDRPQVGPIDVKISASSVKLLTDLGLTPVELISDLGKHYDSLFNVGGGGFFDSYQDYDAHVTFMQNLVASYPSLAEMINIGTSVEGRPLWVIRIRGQNSIPTGLLCHGAQHGNEIMGAAVVAYLAEKLLTHYGVDPELTALVDNVDWFLMPVMNPDGYENGSRSNANGWDLNRNWGGPGTAGGFTQPETAALRDLLASHPHIRTHVDLHAFGRAIIWPWGHTRFWCDDHLTFAQLGQSMAEAILSIRGQDYSRRGPIYSTFYEVVGGSSDYSYDERGSWAWVIEIGYAFYEPVTQIVPSCQEITAAVISLASWSFDCNENGIADSVEVLDPMVADCNGNDKPDECEPAGDLDGDGLISICDPNADGDHLRNSLDICPYNKAGIPVDAEGRPLGAHDRRCEITFDEVRAAVSCMIISGPMSPYGSGGACYRWDFDNDSDYDLFDWAFLDRGFGPPTP